ncbi:nitroreductase family protein [Breznakiella homolactica]|uniref:Nitroreductase family protein n=1 Tax=Breznakiella homolactica TaxID=2798577 RepID=A0A7T7XM84_9SPIR|nr:nitroreductase family protein [Breznakiella homolactica]QQO08920.1 nitroreductase family protein [Breznakiella homolactica]
MMELLSPDTEEFDQSLRKLPEGTREFFSAMLTRYACKFFDIAKKIPPDHEELILEAGRLSPSSFGLEPWLFVSAREKSVLDRLFDACFSQENVRTASFVSVILVRTAKHYHPESEFVRRRSGRFPGGYPVFVDDYRGYWEFISSNNRTNEWARAQGYIAAANMMNAAASLGIDSCALEGFDERKVLDILKADPADWLISLVIPFGYRGEKPTDKIREPLADVIAEAGPNGLTGSGDIFPPMG